MRCHTSAHSSGSWKLSPQSTLLGSVHTISDSAASGGPSWVLISGTAVEPRAPRTRRETGPNHTPYCRWYTSVARIIVQRLVVLEVPEAEHGPLVNPELVHLHTCQLVAVVLGPLPRLVDVPRAVLRVHRHADCAEDLGFENGWCSSPMNGAGASWGGSVGLGATWSQL